MSQSRLPQIKAYLVEHEMREETRRWFDQSSADFETASVLLKGKRYYASAFFGQQAAEKSLNALHIQRKRKPALTHDLIGFCRTLRAPAKVLHAARQLNADYVVARYPDAANGIPAEVYDRKIAVDHLRYAETIMKWVKSSLK